MKELSDDIFEDIKDIDEDLDLKDIQNINLINSQQFIQKLGRENYFEIMREYDIEQKLIEDAILFINEEVPGLEFIIIANIENENWKTIKAYQQLTADIFNSFPLQEINSSY